MAPKRVRSVYRLPGNEPGLRRRGQRWYLNIRVPPAAQVTIGRKVIEQALKTDSLVKARRRSHKLLAEWHQRFDAARASDGQGDTVDQALAHRGATGTPEFRAWAVDQPLDAVAIAHGGTPVARAAERWERETFESVKPKTATMHRQAVALLLDHFGPLASVESVDGRGASDFLSWLLEAPARQGRPRARATVRRIRSSLSSFWDWLAESHLAASNPWLGHRRKLKGGGEKRATFTDTQLVDLLTGTPKQQAVADLLRLGLFSGARLGELCALTAGDVSGGALRIVKGKTKAARRDVPVHPAIKSILDRRAKGKGAAESLFGDVPDSKHGRGYTASKWIGRYINTVTRDPALVFHSIRHQVYTALGDAGVAPRVVSALLGHAGHGMASVYDKGADWRLKRAAIGKLAYGAKVMAAI